MSCVNECLQSLLDVKNTDRGAKESELVKLKKKRRQLKAKLRKQEQRLREMTAAMRVTEEELNINKQNYERVQKELLAMGDDLTELTPKKKKLVPLPLPQQEPLPFTSESTPTFVTAIHMDVTE